MQWNYLKLGVLYKEKIDLTANLHKTSCSQSLLTSFKNIFCHSPQILTGYKR